MLDREPTPRDLLGAIEHIGQNLNAKHTENRTELAALREELRSLQRAFPGDDPDAHRRYHESVIEWRELRNRMIRAALLQAAKVGGVGAIGWVVYALWMAFKMELHK